MKSLTCSQLSINAFWINANYAFYRTNYILALQNQYETFKEEFYDAHFEQF